MFVISYNITVYDHKRPFVPQISCSKYNRLTMIIRVKTEITKAVTIVDLFVSLNRLKPHYFITENKQFNKKLSYFYEKYLYWTSRLV